MSQAIDNQRLDALQKLLNNHSNQDLNVNKTINSADLFARVNGEQNWDDVFYYLDYYLKNSVNTAHPNFANRMWSGANEPSILGEIVTAITNTSACTYESAPVSTLIEQYMISQMLDIVGFKNGEGQMTTGSSNANMIAMMIARNKFLENTKSQGLFGQKKLIAFVNEDAHYSLDKAINILGIGSDNLIKIKTNDLGEMDVDDLEMQIKSHLKNDNCPFFVCATLGTTVRGAYDSITDLVKLREKYNFFLHGDGAWGGSAIMSDKLKNKFLNDIEQLDSFTMDFHKMLNTNLICNFLLVNHNQESLTKTCATGDVSYIFRENSDLGVKSLQCGRRVDSLKWFLDWVYFGRNNFGKRIENYYNLLSFVQKIIKENSVLEIISSHYSFNLCFAFKNKNNEFTQKVRNELYKNNDALLSLAYVKGKLVFRLVIANPSVNEKTLTKLLEKIITIRRNLSTSNHQ
jgi:sulfinoalanine decarboxylase